MSETAAKNSGKFPTFYFSGKVTTLVTVRVSYILHEEVCCCLLCKTRQDKIALGI